MYHWKKNIKAYVPTKLNLKIDSVNENSKNVTIEMYARNDYFPVVILQIFLVFGWILKCMTIQRSTYFPQFVD